MSQTASPYDSQFEENLYQLRRDKLSQIAALVRASNPAISDIEAKYPNTFAFTHTIPDLRALGQHQNGDPLTAEDLEAAHLEAAIAGRIMAIRVQGKAGFATLQQNGQRLQIYVRKDDVGEDLFALYKLLDLGDHIGVRGYLMRTRTGELTLHAAPVTLPGEETLAVRAAPETPAVRAALTFLAKAMLALPDKYHGLEDVELRYRQRYVDLIVNSGHREAAASSPGLAGGFSPLNTAPAEGALAPGLSATDAPPNVREVFVKRAAILRSIRKFFDDRNYLEVETPMLHTISGGAAARPFETHHNALDIPLKLRIAPELYLKRLVVGGFDRVYEINRNFRNEGVSTQHNPEFTMLEFYQAYANYHDLMDLTEELIKFVAMEVNGSYITHFNNTEIDLSHWTKLSMREAIIQWWPKEFGPTPSEAAWFDISAFRDLIRSAVDTLADDLVISTRLREEPPTRWIEVFHRSSPKYQLGRIVTGSLQSLIAIAVGLENGSPLGKSISSLFELIGEDPIHGHLIQPTIIYDFPLAVSPLSKVKPDEPDWVERFEFYIGGFEVGNAFSELNDPDDQRARFEAQLREKERGDDEAMPMDEDYVRALGYGLPPTAGEGIGIDRLTMILTGSRSIRDVILFPLMRPQKPTPETDPETAE